MSRKKTIPVGRAPLVPSEEVSKALLHLTDGSERMPIIMDAEPPWPRPSRSLSDIAHTTARVVTDAAFVAVVVGLVVKLWQWVL